MAEEKKNQQGAVQTDQEQQADKLGNEADALEKTQNQGGSGDQTTKNVLMVVVAVVAIALVAWLVMMTM